MAQPIANRLLIHRDPCHLLQSATSTIRSPSTGPTYLASVQPLKRRIEHRPSHRSRLQLLPYPVSHGRNEKHNLADFRLGMSANGGKAVQTYTLVSTETLAPGRRMGPYVSHRGPFRTAIVIFSVEQDETMYVNRLDALPGNSRATAFGHLPRQPTCVW